MREVEDPEVHVGAASALLADGTPQAAAYCQLAAQVIHCAELASPVLS
ncbi:hypothetical protein [Alicyclobacillus sp. ALC3]|nr:hypothetical protein [Alicyclobacillus sp. ALC3]